MPVSACGARAALFPVDFPDRISRRRKAPPCTNLFSGPARTWRFAGDLTEPLWGRRAPQFAGPISPAPATSRRYRPYRAAVANAFRGKVAGRAGRARQGASSRRGRSAPCRIADQGPGSWRYCVTIRACPVSSMSSIRKRGLLQGEFDRIAAERDLRLSVADLYRGPGR